MTTLNKVNIKGVDYSLDGVKVADLNVEVLAEDDEVHLSLPIESCPSIDFYKGIKIEIYESGELRHTFHFIGFPTRDLGTQLVYINENGVSMNYGELMSAGIFVGGYTYYTQDGNDFEMIAFFSYLEYRDNNFTAKLYYHEADETTPYFGVEA